MKKLFTILMVAFMVMASGLAIQAQAGDLPEEGDVIVLKAGDQFVSRWNKMPIRIKAYKDVEVTVLMVGEKYVYAETTDFPHDCPYHGLEVLEGPILIAIDHSYFD